MAVSRHLGFYWTANSAIRSADPVNLSLEANMEWIGWPFARYSPLNYTVTLKLGFGVTQVIESGTIRYSTYDFIFVFHSNYASIYYRFRDITAYWSKIATPLYLAPPLGVTTSDYATTLGDEKLEWWAYQTVKEFRWYVQPFWYNTRVWQTDRQTDGRNWRGIYAP